MINNSVFMKLLFSIASILLCSFSGIAQPETVIPERVAQPLELQINSEAAERMPLISVDGNRLYFIRSAHPQNMGADNLDDIWMAYFDVDEGWKRAINIGGPINNRYDNAVVGVDPSGDMLYLQNNYPDGRQQGVALSYLSKRLWSPPAPMPIDSFYNLSPIADFSVGVNGGVLLMAVERRDGLGQRDLYISFRKDEASWEAPVHLGNTLNTPGEEAGIYLAPDGKTLYFSSDGHGGLGGLDLFVSKRLDESWTNWSTPQNLGNQVCSPDDDYYISVPVSSNLAFFSKKDSTGNQQIFQVELPESMLPEPVLLISGKIIDSESQSATGGKLSFQQFDATKKLVGYNLHQDGSYKLVVPYGENIAIHAEAEGFFAVSEYLELAEEELEEEDLDPANMLATANLDAAYLQRDEEISSLQLQLKSLNGELKELNEQRRAYQAQLLAERDKLDDRQTAYLRTDPELEALKHRYRNYLYQLQDTIPADAEITAKGITQPNEQNKQEDAELAEMKARFNQHYDIDPEQPQEDEVYLWEEAIGFQDLQQDVEEELKEQLIPIVTKELQEELIKEVSRDLEKSLDKTSLKKATDRVSQQRLIAPVPVSPNETDQESIIKTDLRKVMQPKVKTQIKSELANEVRQALRSELTYQTKKEQEATLQQELDIKVMAQIRHEGQTERGTSNIPRTLLQEPRPAPTPMYKETQQDIFLLPIKEGQIIPLNNIFFNPNTATLKPTSSAELNRVATFLQENPTAIVEFGGHTNGWSSHTFATRLSTNRAVAVVDYLIEKGITPKRLRSKGYGKTMPIATNDTVEGRKKNQRIEMKIVTFALKKGT